LPTYIFTKDGKYELLNGERVGSLATKRASRDYNNHVHNALVFWSWVVSGGENEPFCLETVESNRLPSNEKSRGATNKRGMRGKKLPETILPDGDSSPARILIAPNLAGGVSTDQAPEPESLVSVLDGSSEIFPELEDELTLLAEVNETEQGDAA